MYLTVGTSYLLPCLSPRSTYKYTDDDDDDDDDDDVDVLQKLSYYFVEFSLLISHQRSDIETSKIL